MMTNFCMPQATVLSSVTEKAFTLFLCGDVMTGRGIDQVLPFPSEPALHESFVKDARGYVELAEDRNGPIPAPVEFSYPWGDALAELERRKPSLRIVNLETSVTLSEDWQDKGINYRMNPANIAVLKAARIDVCSLANNHIEDWGVAGLLETLQALGQNAIQSVGAGRNKAEAEKPAIIELSENCRVVIFGLGHGSSGIPSPWAADASRPGLDFLPDLSRREVDRLRKRISDDRRSGDLVIVSIHWGENWGYEIPISFRHFAHALIDSAGVDLIHGHSSHHPKPFEIYRERLILYGCGDFLNDYEGIEGYEDFRPDLSLMYFPRIETVSRRLMGLELVPLCMSRFRLHRASVGDADWLRKKLGGETHFAQSASGLSLHWVGR